MAPTLAARLLLIASLAGCRAFPVGMYVPDRTLDALERSSYDEDADWSRLEAELRARYGPDLEPARAATRLDRWYRLEPAPALGPLAARDLARPGPATSGLEAGDVLMVKNPRAQSLAQTMSFEKPNLYDHLGLLVEREGRWLVCDSWPRFRFLGRAEDFASRFRGGVRATPLPDFLEHYETVLFVRIGPADQRAALARAALDSLDEGIEFDPHHDEADPRLSCAEYLNELFDRVGLARPEHVRPLVDVGDLHTIIGDLGFPTQGFLVPEQLLELEGARAVAWISRHRTVAGTRAIEVAYEILAARFRREGRVGDLLGIDRFRFLRYRRNVARFLGWAEALAEHEGWSERGRLRQELAALEPRFFVR